MATLRPVAGAGTHDASAQPYRDQLAFDRWGWGSHCVDCYPSNCPYRVYVKDGVIVREEQSGSFDVVEPGVPDMNPMGCQKGGSWSRLLYGGERILHPMRRAGERGEGRWTRISWDEALTEISEKMLDTIQHEGPESIVRVGTPGQGGAQSIALGGAIFNKLGCTTTDVQGEINDWSPGVYATFGRFDPCASNDDWFHSDVLVIWGNNPAYSDIPLYHYITETRYHGAQVVVIAPDFSPSAVHADLFAPVRIGSDAALALAMCRVIIDEHLMDRGFVREQTDLPLLVRRDNGRFLRQSDLIEGGRDDIFHVFDKTDQRVAEAPRTLDLGALVPALQGTFTVTLKDGAQVDVSPAFVLLVEKLREFPPEAAAGVCGVHADVIRRLARMVAGGKTHILDGWTFGKSYHGDLIERAMCLVLALTGNWGKQGAGIRSWAVGMFDGMFTWSAKAKPGVEAARQMQAGLNAMTAGALEQDPTLTEELIVHEMGYRGAAMGGNVPPAFFWFNHCGYREIWDRPGWGDPAMKRTLSEYVKEAIDRGWWGGAQYPAPDSSPRVLFEIGGNLLRRQRGGQQQLLKHLWPKLELVVSLDVRMTTTGLWSDIVLPAAHHYEKPNFPYTTPDVMNLTLSDRVVEPPDDVKSEWQFTQALANKLSERAVARGFTSFQSRLGMPVRLDNLYNEITKDGHYAEDDTVINEMVIDSAAAGTLPEETTLETLRETGYVRFTAWGRSPMALAQASDLKPHETHSPFRWQTEKKQPFPTLTRRAQFYIDHDWFLEAGEELPTHKEPPWQGGDYPLEITGGHPRWSANSTNMTNRIILNTHRGKPTVYVNDRDAVARGIVDGDDIRVFNDVSEAFVEARVTPSVRPGQLIMYNGFEPYQFEGWRDTANVEPGMVKWLHFAGGYGHLRYRAIHWQPVPIDRGVHANIELAHSR
ncbi:MAG: molybdopterin-dependent oxidoreductase [Chloroflexi bacterium]|nr:molybdopterin-dependent oxidoreductase [Chloroflexota bacterium]